MTFEFTKRSQIWYFFPSLNNPIEWVRSGSFLQKVKLREVNWLELMRRGVRTRPNSKSHVHSATPPSSLTSLPFRSLTAGGLTSLAGGPADWTTYGDSPGHINQFFSWLSHLLTVRPWPTHGNFVRAFSFLKLGKRSKVRVNMLLNTHVVGGQHYFCHRYNGNNNYHSFCSDHVPSLFSALDVWQLVLLPQQQKVKEEYMFPFYRCINWGTIRRRNSTTVTYPVSAGGRIETQVVQLQSLCPIVW